MRQATRKGLMTVAAATGVIAAAGGQAHAHSAGATGSATGSPGVLSGNTVQAPVHAPVNVCGNTVNVVGVLNPAAGNSCGNHSHGHGHSGGYGDSHGTGGSGGAQASGHTSDSPGVASGNTVQAPVHAPVNACGNSVDVVGVLNPAAGNSCGNHGHHHPGGHGDPGGSGGAQADGHASDSPGVGSGNTVQAPVHAPVNVCGNSVDIIGIGNAAMGNDCANEDSGSGGGHTTPPGDGDGTTPPGTNPPGTNPPGTTPPGTTPPGTPEQPGTPGTPEQPGTPGNPTDPGTPGNPVEPGTPGTPVTPGTPGTPPEVDVTTPGDHGHGNRPGAQSVTQPRADAQLADTGSGLPLGAAASLGAGALVAGAVLYRRARASA